jgi:hypothetical protein
MLDDLAEALGIDPDDSEQHLAQSLVWEDNNFQRLLRGERTRMRVTEQQMADRLGWTTEQVADVEFGDPTLSAIRRYCLVLRLKTIHNAGPWAG